jgi:hypothetical protein
MKRLVSLVLVAVAVLAIGCGNDEKNAYVDKVNEIQSNLQTQATQAAASAPTSPRQADELVKKLEQLYGDAADQLDAVSPPDDVATLHKQLADQFRQVSHQIGALAAAFESRDPQQIQEATRKLQSVVTTAADKFSSLIDQINSQLQS